jgi:hypothetical protein
MPLPAPVLSVPTRGIDITAAGDLVRGAAVGLSTVGVVLVLALAIGLVLLFRRRGGAGAGARSTGARSAGSLSAASLSTDDLALQASAILVRADDAVESAENEVGFALAQFGPDATRDFADAVTDARTRVAEAFRLKQQLDDAHPDSDQQRRDWTKRVIALSDQAIGSITDHTQRFTALRRSEADSPARLQALRAGIEQTRAQLPASDAVLQRLVDRYDPTLTRDISDSVDVTTRALADASARAEQIAARVAPNGVSAISADLEAAAALVHEARGRLSALDETAASLAQAESALADLVASTRADLAEARATRDTAPDAETGARVLRAIDEIDFVLGATESPTPPLNPVHNLARLGSAVSALDTAMAGARNQQQRLAHARTALVGALVGARSEIGVAKGFMANTRADVDARTRLAEAERQLLLAESESDPVAALDAARRAATAARDADALARYRG